MPLRRAGIDATVLRRALLLLLPVAVTATLLCALLYVAVQQAYRQSANDPQWADAVAAASRLDAGADAATVASGPAVDLRTGLGEDVSVYASGGRLLASTARLDGAVPEPPRGVLDAVAGGQVSAVTWEPAPGVRVAAAVAPWRGGAVLVGRSLRLVEDRESRLAVLCALGLAVTLTGAAVTALVAARFWPRPHLSA